MNWILNKVTLGILIVGVAGWFAWSRFSSSEPKDSTLGKVTRADIIQRVTISGLIVPLHTAMLIAPYDGYIHEIFVKIGDSVKANQPIITVTQTPGGLGEQIFPLRAPFAGKVVQILKTQGTFVQKDTNEKSLVRIDDTKELYIVSDTPEMDFPKLKLKQNAIIKASSLPDKTYKGEIVELFQAAREQERWDRSRVEFPIRVKILEKDDLLKPGMSVTMDIITAEAKDALALRHDFVGKEKDDYFVIMRSGERRPVKIGMRSEDAFEILEGVAEGDKVRQVDFLTVAKPVPIGRRNRPKR